MKITGKINLAGGVWATVMTGLISLCALGITLTNGDWFYFGLILAVCLSWIWRFAIVSRASKQIAGVRSAQSDDLRIWHDLMIDVTSAMHKEFELVKADLKQAQGIVADVIMELQGSFNELNQTARSQTNLVLDVVHTLQDGAEDNPENNEVSFATFTQNTQQLLDTFVEQTLDVSVQSMNMMHIINDTTEQMESVVNLLTNVKVSQIKLTC